MDAATLAALLAINQRFYTEFGPAFAATRRRIQEGVRKILETLPDEGHWLDLGCGSGALAVEWLRHGRLSRYTGLDFSAKLLLEATRAVERAAGGVPGNVRFVQANLADENWPAALSGEAGFSGALAFAVMHHLPSEALRLRLLRQVHDLLRTGAVFIHSEWQFQNSDKLVERAVPWETVGIQPAGLEPGDALLDWRYALPGQSGERGFRYVHLFNLGELERLAEQSGFAVEQTFESDGRGGRLGLYQVWRKK